MNTTITPSQRYYENRYSPIRKSLAYSPPRRDGFPYKETPGMTSNDMPLKNNNTIYQNFVETHQAKQSFPPQSNMCAREQQK